MREELTALASPPNPLSTGEGGRPHPAQSLKMSQQSDTKLLISMTLTEISRKYNMPLREVSRMFDEHHIWEQLLSQHEYLHQLPIEETIRFVEELIENSETFYIVYHGTTDAFEQIDLTFSQDRRDFGKGFYTTLLREQAEQWAIRLQNRRHLSKGLLYEYRFAPNSSLSIKRFTALDESWLEFIKENRVKGGCTHPFDVVIGPVADDNTMPTVLLYMNGVYTAQEAIERLRYQKINNQISFHTQKALRCLTLIRSTEIHG